MPDSPAIEARGPFRILRHGGTSWLACTRCVPGTAGELDLLVEMVEDGSDETEQYLAETMSRHLVEAHPPTILGHLGDVRPGWRHLLMNLHARLLEVDPDYRISGLKEKFGELRVTMVSDESREIESLLDAATAESREICVFCGAKPARLTPGFISGVLTCCEAHGGSVSNV